MAHRDSKQDAQAVSERRAAHRDIDDDDEAAAWAAIRRDWEREQMDRADERAEGQVPMTTTDAPDIDDGPVGECPGGLTWDCCHADDCGVAEDGSGCELTRAASESSRGDV